MRESGQVVYKLGFSFSVIVLAACAQSTNISHEAALTVLDYGIYDSERVDHEPLVVTHQVPAKVGKTFGLRLKRTEYLAGTTSFIWRFPEMTNPTSGQVWTEMRGELSVATDQAYPVLARINWEWEAVQGPWTLAILHDGEVIIEETFVLVSP